MRFTSSLKDQRELAKSSVVVEDVSGLESCPKCSGVLRWGEGTWLEDVVWCLYCGWRPVARLVGWRETDV